MPHEISPGTETGADQLAKADTESSALRDYFAATLGDTEGWLAAAFGYGGHFDANGKYTFTEWRPRFYQWPADIERAVAEFTQESHLADVYLSPYVMISAVRRKDDSVSRPILHADVDGELDYAKAVALGPGVFVIDSGRGTHVYVALSESVPLHWHRVLEEGLRDYLGGDDKISDNDLLRAPGTLNRKGAEPAPVFWLIRPTGQRSDVHVVAGVLGATLPDEDAPTASAAAAHGVEPEDVDVDAYPAVRAAVERKTDPPDRSKDQFRIVGACVDAGLDDLGKILGIIYRYRSEDLGKRLAERGGADDVVACLEKVRASRWWLNGQGAPGGDPEKHSGQVRMAYRFAERYADRLLYVFGLGWMWWDGMRWAFDDTGRAHRAVLAVLKDALTKSLGDKVLRRDVQRCESAAGIAGVLDVAKALPQFAASAREMDADPHLLNHSGGTLDLRTFETRPYLPADRLTKVCRGAYHPEAESKAWTTFLQRVLPDAEVRGFLQRYVGVALLGAVIEHKLVIGTGVGANGKSVFDGAIRFTFGDYAITAEPDLFMHRENAHPTGEMDLRGVRWVATSESERDRRLAESTVKRLTGGDTIRARRMRQDFVEFPPSHTAFLITNHLPKVSGDDAAIWRRLRVVPFDVVIPESEQNHQLGAELELVADAILAWAVEGYREYVKREGLDEPASVRAATDDWHRASDAVRRFIDDDCVTTSDALKATTAQLHTAWEKWRVQDGAEPMSQKAFGLALDRHGYPADPPSNGKRWRKGIAVEVVVDDAE